ncbi:MAG: hypothetical protein JRJ84_01140 [Deltaproteobacteria bacterium]|nr:hypothetical protein [Deltaproteobacteria bacterium]
MATSLIVLAMLLWAGPARAQDEIGQQPGPEVHETLVAPPVASAAELVELARTRLEGGDYQGARIALDQALGRGEVDVDLVVYLRGVSWELEGDPAQAIRLYDEGMRQWPISPLHRDRSFRKAEALGTLGVPKEGLEWLHRIDARELEPLDRHKYELVEGILTVQAGRTRKGLRILRDALHEVTTKELTFYQAKARATIARVLADQAAELTFDKGEKKLVKRLQKRATLIDGIEKQVTEAAELDEPEWVLEGLLTLGDAYQAFGDDLAVHRRPRKLTPEQLEVYEEGVLGKVETVWVKAMRSYDLGLDMATRIGWKSRRVEQLRDARERAVARIEGL